MGPGPSFKRHVNQIGTAVSTDSSISNLPYNIKIETVYKDWISYLFDHARRVTAGKNSANRDVEVVFTVPNAWYTPEHGMLTSAAIAAGIVRNGSKIHFVPETEAAVHFAMQRQSLRPAASAYNV